MDQIVRKVKIIGTGSYVPETIYTNEYLESIIDTNADWIFNTLGIKERRIADNNESTSDLAWQAGKEAI
ncbi:MAG: ketoacyl-ACP synthase III, partial [Candidatus Marinimicrobia bacterium]|nr:ketoacyl-ACP synthase III [Candidatus Neomarinimicrobiota bacterium]